MIVTYDWQNIFIVQATGVKSFMRQALGGVDKGEFPTSPNLGITMDTKKRI
jgi:hypothetical protein